MEIERKWLFDMEEVPTYLSQTLTHYMQGYISIEPEVRIRTKCVETLPNRYLGEKTYALCIKSNGTLSREEIQKDLTKEEFNSMLKVGNINKKDLIMKAYYTIPIDNYFLTVGIVDKGKPHEFCYGEIEFSSEEEALAFNTPQWFGEEVTDDPSYKMKNYWKSTRLRSDFKVYIAGKINGLPNYRHRFVKAEYKLMYDGYTKIMNPAVLGEEFNYEAYMPICLSMLDQCDAIYLLDNWKDSQGARLEYEYAKLQGKIIMFE